MTNNSDLVEYVLRLGDTPLVLAQRLTEWCGRAPTLEEDIAVSNVALDLLGQARLWLGYAGELEGAGRDEDRLAFHRDPHEFRNLLLVEQPRGNYADTLVRQFFFDAWHHLALKELAGSADPRIAGISEKAVKEVAYHLKRSSQWVIRLGDGTNESHMFMQEAVDNCWEFVEEMFEMDEIDHRMVSRKVGFDLAAQHLPWHNYVRDILDAATLRIPSHGWRQRGGRNGQHTEHLGHLLTEMQFLQRAYPGAQW